MTFQLQSFIARALENLEKSQAQGSNTAYEEFCIQASGGGGLHEMYEWENYWKYWQGKFADTISVEEERESIFKALILDIAFKGFLARKSIGTQGKMNIRINIILKEGGYFKEY